MFVQCLKILLIFGSFSAVARGEDEYTLTSTSTIASNYNDCYAGDPNCEWKNDPSASLSWGPSPWSSGSKHPTSFFRGSSPRGSSYVRSISPIFRRDDNYACVIIEYRTRVLARSGLVRLRVYQKPVHIDLRDLMAYSDEAKKDYILFDVLGHQGDYWHTTEFPLKHFDSNFQIIIEGIVGEDIVTIEIIRIALNQRIECTGNTAHPISRQTTSTTISTTTRMSTTTTERPMGENGDTISDKVTKSDTWVDSRPASPQSNLWPTTLPITKHQTKTQTLQEGNECYAGDPNCDWENDPSANLSWDLDPSSFGVIQQNSYTFDGLIIYRGEPRGNSSIRMISPIFRRDLNYSCVTFGFRMNTHSKSGLVGLRGYQKPVNIALTDLIAYNDVVKKDYIIFEVWRDQGNYWYTREFPLKHFDSNFQIILEGIFGKDHIDIRIGYIALKQKTECKGQATSTTISTTTRMSTTTTERPIGENGDTITDNGTKSDTWVDSRPASPQSRPVANSHMANHLVNNQAANNNLTTTRRKRM